MTAACTNCGQNSPNELIQAPGGAMVCHACHALAKTAAEVLETGRNAHLRSIDGGGLGVRWLDPVVPRRGYCGSCRGRFPPEELRPATDGNHLCEACETMILRLVKSVQAIAAAEVAGFERGRVPSGNEREDLLEDCRPVLGIQRVGSSADDSPGHTVGDGLHPHPQRSQ